MCARQDLEVVECDLDKLRIAPYKHTWKAHHNSSNLDHMQSLFSSTLHAICIEKVVCMKTGEELCCKVYQSPRLPRAVLTPNLHHGRPIPPGPDARKSTDHQREQSVYRKTCRSLLEDTRRKHPLKSKAIPRLLQHDQTVPRGSDGAIQYNDIVEECRKKKFDGASQWSLEDWM